MADATKPAPSFKEAFNSLKPPATSKTVRTIELIEFDDGTWDVHESNSRRPLGRQKQGWVEKPSAEAALEAVGLLQPPSANPRDEILALIDSLAYAGTQAWSEGYRSALHDVSNNVKKRWPS